MLVLLPIFWLAAVMGIAAFFGDTKTSISAYHGGQYRDVFVAALVGVAISLVAYLGVTAVEDYLLNLAAFFAVFVAIIPEDVAEQIAADQRARERGAPGLDPLQTNIDLWTSIAVIVGCYVISVILLTCADRARHSWAEDWWRRPNQQPQIKGLGWVIAGLATLCFLGYLGLLVTRLIDRSSVFAGLHFTAAILVFVCLGFAVTCRAWALDPATHPLTKTQRWVYRVVILLMILAVGAAALRAYQLGEDWQATGLVLHLELAEVGLFAMYWTVEIVFQWRAARRLPSEN